MNNKLEAEFQSSVKSELEERLPGCMVIVKPGYFIPGFPDLMVLYKNQWAALECKRSYDAPYQPNQEWYIAELDTMGFASMICPENRQEIIDEVLRSFGKSR